ncbi:MAG: hypothetical protein ABSG17_13330 [Spirochaetia bacterium]|jgi:hypothetical protein
MKKLIVLFAILALTGCPVSTPGLVYYRGSVVINWNVVPNPAPILLPGFVLVGIGAPNTPGNPQTIPWPTPNMGDNWLVSDPGYSDDGYIYQWNGSTWVQQTRSLRQTAVFGTTDYAYTSTGWMPITWAAEPQYYYPVYYQVVQTPGVYGSATAQQGTSYNSVTLILDPGTYSFTVSAYYSLDTCFHGSAAFETAPALPSPVSVSVGQTVDTTATLP